MSRTQSYPLTLKNTFLEFSLPSGAAPDVAPSDRGRLYYDATAGSLKLSVGGGSYQTVLGASGSAPITLTAAAASDTPLTITAHASQSQNLLLIENSSLVDQIVVDSSFRLGVGRVASLSYKLEVLGAGNDITSGSMRVANTNSGAGALALVNCGSGTAGAATGLFGAGSTSYTGDLLLQGRVFVATGGASETGITLRANGATHDIRFATGGLGEVARIDTAGFLALNKTSSITHRLEVRGTGNDLLSGAIRVNNTANDTGVGSVINFLSASSDGMVGAFPSNHTALSSTFASRMVVRSGTTGNGIVIAAVTSGQDIVFLVPTSGTILTLANALLTVAEGANVALGTTTGTKVGTATTQKIGFYNATPIVQPAGIGAAATDAATTQALANNLRTALINLGLVAA